MPGEERNKDALMGEFRADIKHLVKQVDSIQSDLKLVYVRKESLKAVEKRLVLLEKFAVGFLCFIATGFGYSLLRMVLV